MKKFLLPPNMVLVRPGEDHTVDKTGFQRADFVDEHLQKSVRARVIAVCDTLLYDNGLDPAADDLPERVQNSMPWDTTIEVQPGDEVLIRYQATIDEDKQIDLDGVRHYVIPYEELLCVIGTLDNLYPVNGFVFVEVAEDHSTIGGFERARNGTPSLTRGKVCTFGSMLHGYQFQADSGDTMMGLGVGKTVLYQKNKAVRIEADEFRTLGYGAYSLYRIQRRHILLLCE